jgi:hypothetical protein
MEREQLRAQATDLLNHLRADDKVPQALFELLDNFSRRLDRLELGAFVTEEETPTRPDRKQSSGGMPAVREAVKDSLSGRIAEIFDEVKPRKDGE